MTDIRTRLADALHDLGLHSEDAAEVADGLLALPGIAIVELPQPDDNGRFWFRETCYVYVDPEDDMIMTQRGTTHGFADEVRETAAALLAAAAEADR